MDFSGPSFLRLLWVLFPTTEKLKVFPPLKKKKKDLNYYLRSCWDLENPRSSYQSLRTRFPKSCVCHREFSLLTSSTLNLLNWTLFFLSPPPPPPPSAERASHVCEEGARSGAASQPAGAAQRRGHLHRRLDYTNTHIHTHTHTHTHTLTESHLLQMNLQFLSKTVESRR